MVAQAEAAGDEGLEVAGASGDVVDAATGVTPEVVVVVEVGGLVAWRLSRKADTGQAALVEEASDGAIDGGEVEGRDALLGERENLGGPERAAGVPERFLDGAALSGAPGDGSLGHA